MFACTEVARTQKEVGNNFTIRAGMRPNRTPYCTGCGSGPVCPQGKAPALACNPKCLRARFVTLEVWGCCWGGEPTAVLYRRPEDKPGGQRRRDQGCS